MILLLRLFQFYPSPPIPRPRNTLKCKPQNPFCTGFPPAEPHDDFRVMETQTMMMKSPHWAPSVIISEIPTADLIGVPLRATEQHILKYEFHLSNVLKFIEIY